jgi:predicted Fe-Mo cluster-binding NifX family protein
MKIAISSDGKNIDCNVNQQFGRCKYFLIGNVDRKNIGAFEAIINEGALQGHGAGIRAAEQIAQLKVDAIITGNLGPNATEVFKKLGIKAYSSSGMISDALKKFVNDELKLITDGAIVHADESKAIKKNDSNERIFFPLLNDDGLNSEISQHFGHAPFFGLYDVNKKELKILANDLNHTDPMKSPIDQIEETVNPTTIFAKGIGARAIELINKKGLKLRTGDYSNVKEAIENLDNLKDQISDCGHKH